MRPLVPAEAPVKTLNDPEWAPVAIPVLKSKLPESAALPSPLRIETLPVPEVLE